jgi:cellulose 1,4-beta-cellobiosidase
VELSVLAAKDPDAPLNLQNAPSVTTAYQVSLTWDEGAYNGASPVIDYQVMYAVSPSTTYILFGSGTTATSLTVTGLTPGTIYNFVVKARNIVGYSDLSASVAVLAAQEPDAPTILANVPGVTLRDQIGLNWVAPVFVGGSPLLDYRVWTDDSGGAFVELTSGLTGTSYTATGLTQGLVYSFYVEARNIYGYSVISNTASILAA